MSLQRSDEEADAFPAELRDRIYEFAYGGHRIDVSMRHPTNGQYYCHDTGKHNENPCTRNIYPLFILLGTTMASRQIRAETSRHLFSNNAFRIDEMKIFHPLDRMLSQQLNMIRIIEVRYWDLNEMILFWKIRQGNCPIWTGLKRIIILLMKELGDTEDLQDEVQKMVEPVCGDEIEVLLRLFPEHQLMRII
ncbi:hypothetical protein NX059_003743 [Plenodomus lindquistii]|nr:hypothetical protein NX059_003743 [Plenodomus lindquistii]